MKMSCNAVAFLYDCECRWRRNGRRSIEIFEPLNIDAPADARPSCWGLNEVTFYDSTGNKVIGRCTTHDIKHINPTLMRVRGTGRWWEVGCGSVRWIESFIDENKGRWVMVWEAWDNTRAARDLNGEADGDRGIRPRPSSTLRQWVWRKWFDLKEWVKPRRVNENPNRPPRGPAPSVRTKVRS